MKTKYLRPKWILFLACALIIAASLGIAVDGVLSVRYYLKLHQGSEGWAHYPRTVPWVRSSIPFHEYFYYWRSSKDKEISIKIRDPDKLIPVLQRYHHRTTRLELQCQPPLIAGEQLQLPNKTTIIVIRHSAIEGWHTSPKEVRPLPGSNFSTPHLNQFLQKVGNQNVKELHLFDVKVDEETFRAVANNHPDLNLLSIWTSHPVEKTWINDLITLTNLSDLTISAFSAKPDLFDHLLDHGRFPNLSRLNLRGLTDEQAAKIPYFAPGLVELEQLSELSTEKRTWLRKSLPTLLN
jgi:hypothetical protein